MYNKDAPKYLAKSLQNLFFASLSTNIEKIYIESGNKAVIRQWIKYLILYVVLKGGGTKNQTKRVAQNT